MAEVPEANSGGLDLSGAPKPKAPLWKRLRAYTILIALYVIIFGMAAAAISMLRSVFHHGILLEDRVVDLMYSVFLLLPLGLVVRYFFRLRMKTGRWRGTPEYIKQERAERRAKCSPATGCGPRKTGWTQYATKWATCAAMDRALPMPQRIAAWVVLALYGLWMLALVAVGLVCFVLAFGGNNSIGLTLTLAGFGIVVLFMPGVAVFKLVRGIRAGKVGATPEDVEEIRAQRSARHQREWQKPLRSKIVSTAISGGILAFMWLQPVIHHARHTHANWIAPAMWTPALIYAIWIQFRRPKNVNASDGGSRTIDGY